MGKTVRIPDGASKEAIYRELLPQIKAVLDDVQDLIANMGNTSAMLKEAFGFHWVGFYRMVDNKTLVLGPFQGPLACSIIPLAEGVCGYAVTTKNTVIVPDVNQFQGHIACSSLSRSEIVVPFVVGGKILFVLDIDSTELNSFDETDKIYLEKIVALVGKYSTVV